MYSANRSQMLDRREMLKIKIKSLAAESKMIRQEENKQLKASADQRRYNQEHELSTEVSDWLYTELRDHRRQVVRPATRLTHLAYGFIRGKTLEQMEPKSVPLTDQQKKQVKEMIRKYGPPAHMFYGPNALKPIEPDCLK